MTERRGPLPIKSIRVRSEVLEGIYFPVIDVALIDRGAAPGFLLDPVEFFKRTAATPGIRELVVKVLMCLLNRREDTVGGRLYRVDSKMFVLPSLFGGGKSHALATLYHVVKVLRESKSPDEARGMLSHLDPEIADYVHRNWQKLVEVKPKVVVVHGGERDYAPAPSDGKPVKSIWGYIADRLGNYQLVAVQDSEFLSPSKDQIRLLLDGSGAVVLIDELVQYYGRIRGEARSIVNQFLMMLSEVMSTEEVRSASVVLTLPYRADTGAVERAHAELVDLQTVKRILDRVKGGVIVVSKPEDLSTIIRRRLFDEDPERLSRLGQEAAGALLEAVPATRVKDYLKRRNLSERLPKTYPIHPETIETLEVLFHHLGEYLQLTRTPLAVIADAVRAVRLGCFSWMGFEPTMVMPYHVPLFIEKTLVSDLPTAMREFQRFVHILKDSVVRSASVEADRCSVDPSARGYVDGEHVPVAYAVATYLWLRSLAGRGLVSYADIYPTADQVSYAILDVPVAGSSVWYDAVATLAYLSGRMPHLKQHGDRWFFRWTPPVAELISHYESRVTPEEVEEKLVEMIKAGYLKEKPSLASLEDIAVAFNAPFEETGDVPLLVVFTRRVADAKELAQQIKYTNTIVMMPDTSATVGGEQHLKGLIEDLKRCGVVSEGVSCWDALTQVLKRVVACDTKLTRDEVERIYSEERMAEGEKPETVNDVLDQIKKIGKLCHRVGEQLVSVVYRSAYLKREGELVPIQLKEIVRERGYLKAIEDALRGDYAISEPVDTWILDRARDLGVDPLSAQGVSLLNVWSHLVTDDRRDTPVVSLKWYVRSALLPARSLEYAVKTSRGIYWKKCFGSREEAVAHLGRGPDRMPDPDFERLVETVAGALRRGEDVTLVHYRHVVREWLTRVQQSLADEVLVFTDGKMEYTLDWLTQLIGFEDIVRTLACFKEKVKVKVELEAPSEVEPGGRISAKVSLSSTAVRRARVRISVSGARAVSEAPGELEVPGQFTLAVEHDGASAEVALGVVVEDERGNVVGRSERLIPVRLPKVEVVQVRVPLRDAKRMLKDGRVVGVRSIKLESFEGYYKSLSAIRELGGAVSIVVQLDRLRLEASKLTLDEAGKVIPMAKELADVLRPNRIEIEVEVPEERAGAVDRLERIPDEVEANLTVLARRA